MVLIVAPFPPILECGYLKGMHEHGNLGSYQKVTLEWDGGNDTLGMIIASKHT